MAIQWTTITWYSRLLTIIFFIGLLPILNFYIGVKYQETTVALEQSADVQGFSYDCPVPVKTLHAAGASSTSTNSTTTVK